MTDDPTFSITTTRFDEDYSPSRSSRITTNFANLARGEHRQQNIRNTLATITCRFNDLAHWDNPRGDRYDIELEIVSAHIHLNSGRAESSFPLLEILDTRVVDHRTGQRYAGIVGNNFSSYVRDYDFSVLLPQVPVSESGPTVPSDFGDLHGALFKRFLDSAAYAERFSKAPVICISVSTSKRYRRVANHHPVLGVEYEQDEHSLTDQYFEKMGLQVRYFMPVGSVATLAFYFRGDLLNDYSNLELISTISTMETFQKIYRPEIYNANATAPALYQPSLSAADYSLTQITYDRDERSQLATQQGKYTEEHFIKPHKKALEQWAAGHLTKVA